MDATPWICPLCPRIFEVVTALADHATLWHSEWLEGGRVPPRN